MLLLTNEPFQTYINCFQSKYLASDTVVVPKTAGSSRWWLTPRTQTQAQRKYVYETAVINLGFRHLGHLGFRIFRRSESKVTKGLQSEL